MYRIGITLGALTILAMFTGCQSTYTASVSVELHNASQHPVTAWITKTGNRDAEWLAPEDLAMSAKPESINGVVIPAGKTGEMGPMSGKFEGDSVPVLRVYAGQLEYDQLLATSVGSGLRVDVTLSDGLNRLEVVNSAKLEVVPAGAN